MTQHRIVVGCAFEDTTADSRTLHLRCTQPGCVDGVVEVSPAASADRLVAMLSTMHREDCPEPPARPPLVDVIAEALSHYASGNRFVLRAHRMPMAQAVADAVIEEWLARGITAS